MLGERGGVAMIEMQPERLGVEFVGELFAAGSLAGASSKTPSMFAGWMPWKWMRVGWSLPLMNPTRIRSPSRTRMVGPGMRPL